MTVKYTSSVNVSLVIRMYFDHNYSIDDICLRLRYPSEAVEMVIKRQKIKNENAEHN